MIAAWLSAHDEVDVAFGIVCSVVGRAVAEPVGLEGTVRPIADLLCKYRDVLDDPRHYGWIEHGLSRPGGGMTWDEWADVESASLLAEAQRLAVAVAAGRVPAVV
jgi:hypothetical protein